MEYLDFEVEVSAGDVVHIGILYSNSQRGDEEIYRLDPDGGLPVALTSDHLADDRWPGGDGDSRRVRDQMESPTGSGRDPSWR